MKNAARLRVFAATALFAGSMGVASAQISPGTAEPPSSEVPVRCWNEATKMVRDGSVSGAGTVGTGGIAPSRGENANDRRTGQADLDRPVHARGLPAC